MVDRTSQYGYAYILHLKPEVFAGFKSEFTKIADFVEERDTIQIATSAAWSRKLSEAATIVFELWTGKVLKSRDCNHTDIEIVLSMDMPLREVDQAYAFGALRFDVMNHVTWKREQCRELYTELMQYGYQLPQVPDSQFSWNGVETPNLASLLLQEVTDYLDRARDIKRDLTHRNQNETVRDLGRLLRPARNPVVHQHKASV